ncbi:LysR family transcriptional regulator [Roseivivax sp. THAF30]|uniref:LysR family transcriptional regulator n=1 Tax=Roseivivax sp. THAF30 TaxID=2587852 RepID=UPI001267B01A|nr:LysR family transcriptional regulator [Roseivivax sp. THAF30]QFT62757.1 HTH-type transcriptional activator CmpR [Roseivivax sp. THAF30]
MKHLRIYTAIRLIQRQGSIRKAADMLAVSPSALNRSIQNFEESIGAEIFERIPSGVRLTSAGELLLDVVDRHLVEFSELQRQFGNLRDGEMGALRVGLGADIAAGLPLEALADLEADMPGISVEVSSGREMRRLRNRDIDLAVLTNPETDRSVEVLAAGQVPLVVCASADWTARGGRIGLWDLVDERLVLPPEGTGARAAIAHAIRRHALEEGPVTSVAAPYLAQLMRGAGRVCIFPATIFAGVEAELLQRIAIDIGAVQISVLRLAGAPMSRPAERFLRFMEARLDGAGQ